MAVYTKVSESEATEFLRAYELGELRELVGIKQGIQNTNYVLYTTQGRYILTLYEPRNVREEDLPFFLGLMEHLAKKGVPCPLPVRTKNGQMLGRLAEHPAAIIQFLNGKATARITPDDCTGLGRSLASMHAASADFSMRRDNILAMPAWDDLLKSCKPRADEVMPGLAGVLQEELDYLRPRWPTDLPSGVIHADLFPDNVFFGDEASCDMFDFYFACNDFLAYDLAICLNAWCFENNMAFNITKARKLIKGYQGMRPLKPDELKALPLLARGAAMRFLLTRLYDWLNQVPGALVKVKNPLEYLSRLQFHQMVTDIDAYGLDP
jgi:homoserine kinase type II